MVAVKISLSQWERSGAREVNDTTVWCQSPSVTEPQRDSCQTPQVALTDEVIFYSLVFYRMLCIRHLIHRSRGPPSPQGEG